MCNRPMSREAAEANIVFLRLVKDEYVRLGATQVGVENTEQMIRSLESTPIQAISQTK